MSYFSPIHHTFGPLADRCQVRLALRLLWHPSRWIEGSEKEAFKQLLGNKFSGEAMLFSSGREALLAILRSLRFSPGEEVIVQGYTCIVVPNAIIAAGMTPVFVDIDRNTLNLDIEETAKAITPKTRAIICQHTFGIPADTQKLRALCDRHSLILIEDCAHIIPDRSGPSEIGRHGDLFFFSFGRDKAISGVSGGAVVCKKTDLCARVRTLEEQATPLGRVHIMQHLFYPLLYALSRPLYCMGIGKILLAIAGKIRLLPKILTRSEKKGIMQPMLHRMPNACAALALAQLCRLGAMNDHRRMLTSYYALHPLTRAYAVRASLAHPSLPLQKFPLFVPHAQAIRRKLKRQNIHLYDGWTGCVICPANADTSAAGYHDGDDPSAEMAGEQILSLPTHPGMTLKQAKELTQVLLVRLRSP